MAISIANLQNTTKVLLSADLLPLILNAAVGGPGSGWKKDMTRFILVNKAFFDIGTGLIWKELDNLSHALSLLPWYSQPYGGLGMHPYAGAQDWERFNFYASRVERLTLHAAGQGLPSLYWILEFTNIPGKPAVLFPKMKSVTLKSSAFPSISNVILLLSPSVVSLDIASCKEIGGETQEIPTDWAYRHNPGLQRTYCDLILSVTPSILGAAQSLKHLRFCGPTSPAFLFQIGNGLHNLTSLRLIIANAEALSSLANLKKLPRLQTLHIDAPISLSGSYGGGDDTFQSLESLSIIASVAQQNSLQRLLNPSTLQTLHLSYIQLSHADASAVYSTLAQYLRRNPDLQSVSVEAVPYLSGIEVPASTTGTSLSEAEAATTSALASHTNMKTVKFTALPWSMAPSLVSALSLSMPNWGTLTKLSVTFASSDPDEHHRTQLKGTLPGLDFLATTVWAHCPLLETLEFYFDAEDVKSGRLLLPESLRRLPGGVQPQLSRHPLRELFIATFVDLGSEGPEGPSLDLDMMRSMEVALFIDRLFPHVHYVRGTARTTWKEVEVWVASSQQKRIGQRA